MSNKALCGDTARRRWRRGARPRRRRELASRRRTARPRSKCNSRWNKPPSWTWRTGRGIILVLACVFSIKAFFSESKIFFILLFLYVHIDNKTDKGRAIGIAKQTNIQLLKRNKKSCCNCWSFVDTLSDIMRVMDILNFNYITQYRRSHTI